jgi:hypothetical protein
MVEFLAAAALLLQDDPKIFIKDGKAPAVYYGWSPVLDLWGNIRRGVIALRPDGTIFWGAPRDSFEQFSTRGLTDEEKQACGRYEFSGAEFKYTYRDGSDGKGEVEFNADGSIKIIKANLLRYFPIRHGVPFELTGYWSNTTSYNNAAYKMSTTAYNNFSFFKGGVFVLESGAGTISTAVQETTRRTETPTEIRIETIRAEVTRFYGGDPSSKMGKYRVVGSGLMLEYDNGTKETRFLGTIQADPREGYMILLGGALYEGKPGVFPKSGVDAPAPPPRVAARVKTPQFELDGPIGWPMRDQEQQGSKIHFLVPEGVSAAEPFVLILMGATLDKSAKASDPAMAKELEGVVKMLAGAGTVKSAGAPEKLSIDGADASRAPFSVEQDGRTFRVEVTCAIRDGNAMLAIALGSEAGVTAHGGAARTSVAAARLAAAVPKQKVAAAHFELELPKDWKSKDAEQDGNTYTMLIPPGDAEDEYTAFAVGVAVGDTYKSATEKAAIAELRGMIRQVAPGTEAVGEPETLKADGEPAVLLKHRGRNEGEVFHVHAYMVVKHGKAVIVMVAGKEKRADQYAATIREAVESLRVKK